MKWTLLLLLPLLLFVSAAPLAYAANIPVLDSNFHIVPDAHDLDPLCPVGAPLSFGAVLDTVQRGMNAAISFGILIFVMIMAWAGFQFIMSVTNPEARSHARGMLLNAAIGLLIVLSAWLIVDFVMKTLYAGAGNGDTVGAFGPWNSILNGGNACVIAHETQPLYSGGNIFTTGPEVGSGDLGGTGSYDGSFTYQSGIEAQKQHMSPKLAALLSCMATKVPAGVGQISSISDSKIVSGAKIFAQCAQGQCAHAAGSCHYGGKTCVGSSYGVDFGDEQNISRLSAAARACGANYVGNEGNHLHVSVGAACGCN